MSQIRISSLSGSEKRFIAMFVSVIVVVFFVSYFSFLYTKKTISEQVSTSSEQTIAQVADKLNLQLGVFESISIQAMKNMELRKLMMDAAKLPPERSAGKYLKYASIEKILTGYKESNPNLVSVRIMKTTSVTDIRDDLIPSIFWKLSSYQSNDAFVTKENKDWLHLMSAERDNIVWTPIFKKGFFSLKDVDVQRVTTGDTFVMSRRLQNLQMPAAEKVLMLEIKSSAIEDILSSVQFGQDNRILVVDDQNRIIFSKNRDQIGEIAPMGSGSIPDDASSIITTNRDGQEELLVVRSVMRTNWHVIGHIPTSILFENAQNILWISVISLLFISIVMVFAILLIRRFVKANTTLQAYSNQLEKQSSELAVQRDELQHLNRIKDQILANTSHELRTPLNGIIGIAESMLDGVNGKMNETAMKNLRLITASGRRLNTLVNDILDFNKMKNKKLELRIRPLPPGPLLEMTVSLLRPLIGNKPVELIDRVSHAALPSILADENRMQQILHNLLSNAIKFTEKGTIEIDAISEDQYLKISFRDSGIGIPSDKLEDIFKSFEQVDGSIERNYGGTGLGLAVTKQLVELHGGTITVHSSLHEGSVFELRIPVAFEQTESASEQSEQTGEESSRQSKTEHLLTEWTIELPFRTPDSMHQKILIVDDEPINQQVLVNHLSQHDYEIWTAGSGVEALALIQSGQVPDLILMDVMMPRMSGYETTQAIRKTYPPHQLPILILTAKNAPEDLISGFVAGANDYLTKPMNKAELLARMNMHLQIAQANKRISKEA